MSKFNNGLELSTQRHPIYSAGIILILAFLGFLIIGPMIGFLFGFPFFDGTLAEYTDLFLGGDIMNKRFKTPAFVMQGTASTIGFILIPLLAMIIYEKQTVMVFFKTKKTIGDIVEYCKTHLATNIKSNDISGKLASLVRQKTLRREKNSETNLYEYLNA